MKKDIPTITRFFIALLLVFALWLYLIHKVRNDGSFGTFFGGSNHSSLFINNIQENS